MTASIESRIRRREDHFGGEQRQDGNGDQGQSLRGEGESTGSAGRESARRRVSGWLAEAVRSTGDEKREGTGKLWLGGTEGRARGWSLASNDQITGFNGAGVQGTAIEIPARQRGILLLVGQLFSPRCYKRGSQ